MLELFGNTGSVTGSANLVPEQGLNRDIGLVVVGERLAFLRQPFVEVAYLDNTVDNLILFFPNSQYTSRPENIGSARIRGWEGSFSTLVGERVRVSGNYTRLDTEDTGPIPYYRGNELPGRPRDDAALFIDVMPGRWTLGYELHYIGKNYLDPSNMTPVPAREIHGARVQLRLFDDAVSLTAEGKNLSNNQIRDVSGFPLPGRAFFVTLNFQH
jgi:iron complex outermembrane receptor protein